jgi:hypothetical protein
MPANGTEPLKCPACGAENRPTRLFCANCGAYMQAKEGMESAVKDYESQQPGTIQPPAIESIIAQRNSASATRAEIIDDASPVQREETPIRLSTGSSSMSERPGRPRRSRVWTRIVGLFLFLLLVGAGWLFGSLVYGSFFKKSGAAGNDGPVVYAVTTSSSTSTTKPTSTTKSGTAGDTSTTPTASSSTTRTTGQFLGSPIIPKSAVASSTLPSDSSASYGVDNLTDNSLLTAWSIGTGSNGIGEWVRFEFGKSVKVDTIQIANGYQKDTVHFRGNPRVHMVRVNYSDGSTELVNLYDVTGYQYIPTTGRTTSYIQFVIVSVYPGSQWEDTSLSEIRFFGVAG